MRLRRYEELSSPKLQTVQQTVYVPMQERHFSIACSEIALNKLFLFSAYLQRCNRITERKNSITLRAGGEWGRDKKLVAHWATVPS
jgi:hypothetical protein